MNRINRKSGFTIIELLVVVVIVFILFGVVAGTVGSLFGTSDGSVWVF
jgi:prepilin-type N-terminal cleavage/methylation domain-containing protein